jgi:hypothetical protein
MRSAVYIHRPNHSLGPGLRETPTSTQWPRRTGTVSSFDFRHRSFE